MKIFINYRRDDSAGYAGRLFDHLAAHFGAGNVFMDIDTIQPGEDFRKVVKNAVGTCDIVLVMIGKQWLSIKDEQGRRRLDDPRDWVRVEIASSLANPQVRVIPVLVREAAMPGPEELPDELRELAYRNAIELSDNRFQYDANHLVGVIERAGKGGKVKISGAGLWAGIIGVAALGLIWMFRSGILPFSNLKTPTATSSAPAPTLSSTDTPPPIAPTDTPPPLLPTGTPPPPSPTSEIVDTPTNPFPLNVRKLEYGDQNLPSLWTVNAIKLEDMRIPGRMTYSGVARAGQEYRFSLHWCATDPQTLVDNMDNMRISFYVNGELLSQEYVLPYDYDDGNLSCRNQVVGLSGWIVNNSYVLEVERNILTEIFDGMASYPAGVYIRQLNITAE